MHLVSSRATNSLVLYHYKSRFNARDEALVILSHAEPHPHSKTFPSFDERIGWSIHGVYDDEGLPVEVEERLSRFFKPHDDAFFEILGRRLAWRT